MDISDNYQKKNQLRMVGDQRNRNTKNIGDGKEEY